MPRTFTSCTPWLNTYPGKYFLCEKTIAHENETGNTTADAIAYNCSEPKITRAPASISNEQDWKKVLDYRRSWCFGWIFTPIPVQFLFQESRLNAKDLPKSTKMADRKILYGVTQLHILLVYFICHRKKLHFHSLDWPKFTDVQHCQPTFACEG